MFPAARYMGADLVPFRETMSQQMTELRVKTSPPAFDMRVCPTENGARQTVAADGNDLTRAGPPRNITDGRRGLRAGRVGATDTERNRRFAV